MQTDMTINPAFYLLAIGLVFIGIGCIFIPVMYRKIRADRAALLWPQTLAMLVSVETARHVRERPREEHPGLSVSYACVLNYQYMVKGISYSAQHGIAANNAEHAAKLAAQQVLESRRNIYYNPAQPEQYRIERASVYVGLLWLLPFAAFAGFGLLLLGLALGDLL